MLISTWRGAPVPSRLLDDLAALPVGLPEPPRGPLSRPQSMELSPREIEVARYFSRGLTTQMVAEAMGLSPDTIRVHARGLRYRLRAKNTLHAVCECLRRGLID